MLQYPGTTLQHAITPTCNYSNSTTRRNITGSTRKEHKIVPGTIGQRGQRTELVGGAGELHGVVVLREERNTEAY